MKRSTPLLSLITTVICLPLFAQVNLEVASGGEMYISPEAYVYVSNSGNVNIAPDPDGDGPNLPGSLIMNSDSNSFSDLYIGGTSSGDVEYRRFTASAETRDLVSPPVSGQTFMSLFDDNPGVLADGTITSNANRMFGPLNDVTKIYEEYGPTETTPLQAARGYRVGTVSGGTLTYTGIVRTDDVSINTTFGEGRFRASNVVGNPYTTHLSARQVLNNAIADNAAIPTEYKAIYGWNGTANSISTTWNVINNATLPVDVNDDSVLLTPGQAFLVFFATDGSFIFPETARRVSEPAEYDDFITGRTSANRYSFKLQLTSGSSTDETSLYFIDSFGSRGVDPTYDAAAFGTNFGTHLVDNSQGVNLTIQVLSTSDLSATDYAIPVHVNIGSNQEATLSIENLNLPLGTKFYLEDTELNTETLLTSEDYTFTTSSALNGIGRFYLRTYSSNTFSNASSALNTVEVLSFSATKQIAVRGHLVNDSVLKLYDIRGRVIDSYELDASQTNHLIDVSSISSGIYIVNLNNKNQSKTTKLVIN